MTEKEIRELMEPKKDQIKQSLKDRLTYDKWDKVSPIWGYRLLTKESKEITDLKAIDFMLSIPHPYVIYFSTKESMEIYKWVHELIETEINNRILESFSSGNIFDNYVSVKDLNLGD